MMLTSSKTNGNSSTIDTPSTSQTIIANGNKQGNTQNSLPPKITVVENALALREDDISTYKCSICNNFLSIPPIVRIDQSGKQYLCGRCQHLKSATTDYTRNFLYENVARFLLFPCIYKNCPAKLLWGSVENHEKNCPKRTITCPMYQQSCHDTVEVAQIEAHFSEKHMTNIKHFEFIHELAIGENYVCLWKFQNLLFLVYILLTDELSTVNIFSFQQLNNAYACNVKIEGNSGFSCLYENQRVEMFDERKFCFKCLNNECSLKWHEYSQTNKATKNQEHIKLINKSTILQILGSTEVVKVSLHFILELEMRQLFISFYMNSQNNEIPLQNSFQCPNCNEYMIPPIYVCYRGHTICKVCCPKLKNCPTCKKKIGKTRNFILEELSENIELPCQYKKQGCRFSGKVILVKQHQSNDCTYAMQPCEKRKKTLEDN